MDRLVQDVRFALRTLRQKPGFAALVIVCLALGIGVNSTIFSVVDTFAIRPLPFRAPDELVALATTDRTTGQDNIALSFPELQDVRARTSAFAEIAASTGRSLAVADRGEDPERILGSAVTGNLFPTLGIQPVLGRLFRSDEDAAGAPRVTLLSHGLWQRRYAGDPSIVGRTITINNSPYTVIGVMPPRFQYPDQAQLWVALTPLEYKSVRGNRSIQVLARLKPGVSIAQARENMNAVGVQLEREYLDNKGRGMKAWPLRDAMIPSEMRLVVFTLMGAVSLVLLIACANVANLLIARSEARRREIAVRVAIGASARKLLQQFVLEGFLLSITGAALGMLLAFGGLKLLVATNAGSIPRSEEIGIDWRVLVFTLGVSVLTGMTFGFAPVIHTRASALHDTLKAAAGRTTATAMANRFRAVLVTAELALALVLLIGSGLMVKAFWRLIDVKSGVDSSNLLTMRFSLPGASYRDAAAITSFHQSLTARVQAIPGVAAAALVTGLPPVRQINANTTLLESAQERPGARNGRMADGIFDEVDYYNSVGPRYFQTVGARLLDGRFFNDGDGPSSNPVVMVNETMARTYWPTGAVGHRIRVGPPTAPWRTIVGVVSDIKNAGLDRPTGTELYFPITQSPARLAYLFVKTKVSPQSVATAVRSEFRSLDRGLPIANMKTMDEVMDSARSRPKFLTMVLTLFSSISLLLAALGIYGVISYSVAQRTNELGIRMALGAQSGDVLKLVGWAGLRLAIAGTVLGAIGAFALTRTMSGFLFGVSSFDIGTFAAMAAALMAVTMVACWIPARRAAKVDPTVALRYE